MGLKNMFVIERCPLLTGVSKKAVTFGLLHLGLTVSSTIQGMSAIWDVRYWEVLLYL